MLNLVDIYEGFYKNVSSRSQNLIVAMNKYLSDRDVIVFSTRECKETGSKYKFIFTVDYDSKNSEFVIDAGYNKSTPHSKFSISMLQDEISEVLNSLDINIDDVTKVLYYVSCNLGELHIDIKFIYHNTDGVREVQRMQLRCTYMKYYISGSKPYYIINNIIPDNIIIYYPADIRRVKKSIDLHDTDFEIKRIE